MHSSRHEAGGCIEPAVWKVRCWAEAGAVCGCAQPSPQVLLHDVKVEGQWNRVRQEGPTADVAARQAAEPFRR